MNSIDIRIIEAVTTYYREHQEPPALCIIHPVLYSNKTIYDVKIPLMPKPLGITETTELSPMQPGMEYATIRIEMMATHDQIVQELEPIVCLSPTNVIEAIINNPYFQK